MTQTEALKLALEALEKLTTEMLALRDELAERGGRPETNAFHQRLWDSSFKAYTDYALPSATAIKEALSTKCVAQPAVAEQHKQEPVEMYRNKCADGSRCLHGCHTNESCYTTPPQPKEPEQEPDWKGLVLSHNEECESRCDKERCGYAPYFEANGRRCPSCPVHDKIWVEYPKSERS